MNFLPECKGRSPDYWCTWETQNCLAEHDYDEKSVLGRILSRTVDPPLGRVRAMINETTLFGETDLIHQFPEVRASLFLMLDDGWDLPFSVDRSKTSKLFGSLMLNEERFPSCVGSPEERLKKLNDMVKAEGWRGIGIWVCAQSAGDNYRAPFDDTEEHRAYWRERIEMCREADVRYWKVDWGTHCFNAGFRKMLTDMAHEIFPPCLLSTPPPAPPSTDAMTTGKPDLPKTRRWQTERKSLRSKATCFVPMT